MGFLSRTFIPRGVRKAAHPVRTVKSSAKKAVTPKSVKKVQRALNPLDSLQYGLERKATTAIRSGGKTSGGTPVYRHGSCPVKHRSAEAAVKCRNA